MGLGLISCELEWPQWFELRTLWESPTISAHIRKELGSSICSQVNTGADIDMRKALSGEGRKGIIRHVFFRSSLFCCECAGIFSGDPVGKVAVFRRDPSPCRLSLLDEPPGLLDRDRTGVQYGLYGGIYPGGDLLDGLRYRSGGRRSLG